MRASVLLKKKLLNLNIEKSPKKDIQTFLDVIVKTITTLTLLGTLIGATQIIYYLFSINEGQLVKNSLNDGIAILLTSILLASLYGVIVSPALYIFFANPYSYNRSSNIQNAIAFFIGFGINGFLIILLKRGENYGMKESIFLLIIFFLTPIFITCACFINKKLLKSILLKSILLKSILLKSILLNKNIYIVLAFIFILIWYIPIESLLQQLVLIAAVVVLVGVFLFFVFFDFRNALLVKKNNKKKIWGNNKNSPIGLFWAGLFINLIEITIFNLSIIFSFSLINTESAKDDILFLTTIILVTVLLAFISETKVKWKEKQISSVLFIIYILLLPFFLINILVSDVDISEKVLNELGIVEKPSESKIYYIKNDFFDLMNKGNLRVKVEKSGTVDTNLVVDYKRNMYLNFNNNIDKLDQKKLKDINDSGISAIYAYALWNLGNDIVLCPFDVEYKPSKDINVPKKKRYKDVPIRCIVSKKDYFQTFSDFGIKKAD